MTDDELFTAYLVLSDSMGRRDVSNYYIHLARMKLQHEEAVKRRTAEKEIKEKRNEIRVFRNQKKNDGFLWLSIEDQLLMIARDTEHEPNWYPINLNAILKIDLGKVPLESLQTIYNRFSSLKSADYQEFAGKIKSVMEQNVQS